VRAFIAGHPELQPTGERLLLRQLILPDLALARSAADRVRHGESFATLSRDLSRAPNADSGGALGWIERGQLAPEFEAAVFGLAAGSVSAPVESGAGWHVFQVVERRTGSEPDPSSLIAARAVLAAEKAERARRACLRALAERVGVDVRSGTAAPFPCHNPFEEKT
jgi:peptidyl-prolyl cis-trans isomerase C